MLSSLFVQRHELRHVEAHARSIAKSRSEWPCLGDDSAPVSSTDTESQNVAQDTTTTTTYYYYCTATPRLLKTTIAPLLRVCLSMSHATVAHWLEADVSSSSSSNLPCRMNITIRPKMRFKSGFPQDYYVNDKKRADLKTCKDTSPSLADKNLSSVNSKQGTNKMPKNVDLHSLDWVAGVMATRIRQKVRVWGGHQNNNNHKQPCGLHHSSAHNDEWP